MANNYGIIHNAILARAGYADHNDAMDVVGTDVSFVIDSITRKITNKSGKNTLVQNDHNSERIIFECPKTIEGHDMTRCNKVSIHYSDNGIPGIYEVDDLIEKNESMITFTWLVSNNVTQEAGTIQFSIDFECVKDGNVTYKWQTGINSDLNVIRTIDNNNTVVYQYVDILEQWKRQLQQEVANVAINENAKNILVMLLYKAVYTEESNNLIESLAAALNVTEKIENKTKVYSENSGGLKVQDVTDNLAIKQIEVTKPSGIQETVNNIALDTITVQGVTDTVEVKTT